MNEYQQAELRRLQQAEFHRIKKVALSIPRCYLSSRTASGRNGERWSIARKILGLSYGPLPAGLTRQAA